MRRYYNRTAFLETVGLLFLSIGLIVLVVTGRARRWIAPRSEGLLLLAAFFVALWALSCARNIPRWKRRVQSRALLLFFLPTALFFLPYSNLTPGGLFASNVMAGMPEKNQTVSPLASEAPNHTQKEGTIVREVTSQEADRLLEEARKKDAEIRDSENRAQKKAIESSPGSRAVNMPNGTMARIDGLDTKAKTIDISFDQYYPWLVELFQHADAYVGYTVSVDGFAFHDPAMGEHMMVARYLITCCLADAMPAGILVKDCEPSFPDNGTWIHAVGTVEMTEAQGKKQPMLILRSRKPISPPENQYIYDVPN